MNKFLLDGIRFETQTGVNDEDCHNVGEMKMPQHFSHNPARAFK